MGSDPRLQERMEHFERVCLAYGLARTHQRQIIYRTLAQSDAHPNPEALYEQVRREIPAISLGTVYKNITTFLRVGLLRELNLPHEPLRLDPNLTNHHHVICTRCRTVIDLAEDDVEPVRFKRKLPAGFRMERYEVDVLGLCAKCVESTSGKGP